VLEDILLESAAFAGIAGRSCAGVGSGRRAVPDATFLALLCRHRAPHDRFVIVETRTGPTAAVSPAFNWIPFRGQLENEVNGIGTILEGSWPFAGLSYLAMTLLGEKRARTRQSAELRQRSWPLGSNGSSSRFRGEPPTSPRQLSLPQGGSGRYFSVAGRTVICTCKGPFRGSDLPIGFGQSRPPLPPTMK
jgi:hypothetical protein